MRPVHAFAIVVMACRSSSREAPVDDAPPAAPHDALVAGDAPGFAELADYVHVEPERAIALPSKPDVPRFDVGGPAVLGDIAVVASSQFGFIGVDYKRGAIAWSKPAGLHVAPPVVIGREIVLVAECLAPPQVDDRLLGCVRVVTETGADESYVAIHGGAALAPFAEARGVSQLWPDGDHGVRWRRGDRAITVDLVTGVASPAPITPPPLVIAYKDKRWELALDEHDEVVATGKRPWRMKGAFTALLGAVYLPDQAPMVRLARFGRVGNQGQLHVIDVDATGSKHGQVSFPVPGIQMLGHAASTVGDVAIAIRLDRSLRRDYIAGFAANAALMWVYPLPAIDRADPVGLAVTPDATLVFHDGDTLTVLPELSAPPTAPGAVKAPSQNPTP